MYSLNYRQPRIDYSSVYSSLGKDVFDDEEEEKKSQGNSSSIIGSLGSLGNIASGLFGNSNNDKQYGLPTQSMPTFKGFGDSGKVGEYASDIFGLGKKGFDIYKMFGSSGAGAGSSSGFGAYIPAIMGAVNAGSTAIKGGSFKDDVPQAFFSIDSKNDSDVMQALKGAGQGALMGTSILPGWGTAIGAVLGLGASFLDDI
jgi:hypothetical protein